MTLSEFKAWFEGFTEDMSGAPSVKQWKKIQTRVAEITGNPVTERVFFDRYWPHYYGPHYYPIWGLGSSTTGGVATSATDTLQLYASNSAWSGESAFAALGKADALTDAA